MAGGAIVGTIGAGAGVGAKAVAGTGVAPETPKSIFEISDLLEVSSDGFGASNEGLLPVPNPIEARVF